MMTPATLKLILANAPRIIQAADKALKMIRGKGNATTASKEMQPVTVEDLKQQIIQIETRLSENFQSDEQQIALIEQLANQNKALAETLQQTYRKVTVLTYLSVVAVVISAAAIFLIFSR